MSGIGLRFIWFFVEPDERFGHRVLIGAEDLQADPDERIQLIYPELGDQNVWVAQRLREIRSLDAIIDRLETDAQSRSAVAGAGTKDRLPLLQIQTRGAHQAVLDNAQRAGKRTGARPRRTGTKPSRPSTSTRSAAPPEPARPGIRPAPEQEEGTVASALRRKMTAQEHEHKSELSKKDREIKDLKQEIAALNGELLRLQRAAAPGR
ncbi:MAG: hypothetical protein ACRC20_14045 [Segniliparus sp.]|uniref:hypothetical protein n=1 Tax=Segniliparus sp. TaxID=2804064 RepID=UPI003F359078